MYLYFLRFLVVFFNKYHLLVTVRDAKNSSKNCHAFTVMRVIYKCEYLEKYTNEKIIKKISLAYKSSSH